MKKILTVDDSRSMLQMVSMTLRVANYEVHEAADGAIALAMAQQQQFDAVITDINMPNMNGIELVQALRAMPDYKFTPVLCLTTESSDDMKGQGKAAGATGWLVKPFSPEKLLGIIERLI